MKNVIHIVPPFPEELVVQTSIGGRVINASTLKYAESIQKRIGSLQDQLGPDYHQILKNYFTGKQVDLRMPSEDVDRELAIREVVSLIEFTATSLRLYRTQRGRSFDIALGVHNPRYTSVIGLLADTEPDEIFGLQTTLRQLRKIADGELAHSARPDAYLLSVTVIESAMPLLKAMHATRWKPLTLADTHKWITNS